MPPILASVSHIFAAVLLFMLDITLQVKLEAAGFPLQFESPPMTPTGHPIGPLRREAGIYPAAPTTGSPITKDYMRNLVILGSSFQFASLPPGSI
jgi:hypothetical protein